MTLPTKKPLPSAKKPKKLSITKWIILLLIIVMVGAVGFVLYRSHQAKLENDRAFQADKARFAQVEKDMQVAYDAMISAAGKPDRSSHAGNCAHTSAKFSSGTLTCGVYYEWNYNVEDGAKALRQVKSALKTIDNSTYSINPLSQNTDTLSLSDNQSVELKTYLDNHADNTKCSLIWSYAKNAASYDFRCESAVDKSVYTLAE